MDDECVEALTRSIDRVAHTITPNAMPGHDATGGYVISLTEAVMGITAGLMQIVSAISELAEAVRDTAREESSS